MDQYSSVLGATAAGKLPSQEQVNKATDWLLQSNLIQVEAKLSTEGQLSPQGKKIVANARQIVEAYKSLGTNKNGDDILQEGLWNLAQGAQASDVEVKVDADTPADEGRKDARELSAAIRTIVNILLTNITGSGSSVFGDFASFIRLGLADAAEAVESQASSAKDALRSTDQEVKEGQRDSLGRPIREGEEGQDDPRAKFENTMDTIKDAGSKTIGTGQKTTAAGREYADKSQNRLSDMMDNIVRRSQGDGEYQSALRTLFGLARKWVDKSTSSDSDRPMELDTFINDSSGRLPTALRQLRTLVERCAGGKSLDDILNAVNDTGIAIRKDDDLRKFIDDYLVFAQHNLESVDYAKSEDGKRTQEHLNTRAKDLGLEKGSEKRKEYQQSLSRLGSELDQYEQGFLNDPDINRLKDAHLALSKTIISVTKDAVGVSGNVSLTGTTWVLQDALNVYLPRVISLFKDIPLPRTEYVSPEVEFVFENVDISSINILPGNAHIKHVTDINVSQSTPGAEASTSMGGTTEIQLQGVQTTLREISFYYKDSESKTGVPDTFTGLVDVTLPSKGLDINISLSMLPTDAHNERQKAQRFFKANKVHVNLSDDITLNVKKSNHAILVKTFKPIVKKRFRAAFEAALTEQFKFAVDFLDSTAYDVHKRSGVFKDGGAPASVAYAAALWSEIGRLRQLPGPLTGWKMMGHGVVKDDERTDKAFAIGTEPMLLSGDKHGPQSQFTEKKTGSVDGGAAQKGAEQGKQGAQKALEKGKGFKERVEAKREQERRSEGWRSSAFDNLAPTGPAASHL